MGFPYAYFLTWTCYGTRLHGHADWSVDRAHNKFNTPPLPANVRLERSDRRQMKHERIVLTPPQRGLVVAVIREHATYRGWDLRSVNVRTTHVHVVVRAERQPETVMDQFKAWGTRRLHEHGYLLDRKVWTPHGSTRYLWNESDVPPVIDYVENWQDLPGMPPRVVEEDEEAEQV